MSTTLEIETLYKALQEKLGLVWLSGEQYKHTPLHTSADTSADISLVGYLNLITLHRVQVLGRKEMEYLDSLKKNSRKDTISQLFSGHTNLVVIAKRLPPPDDLEAAAAASQIPLLSSDLPSQDIIENLQHYLTNYFADKITLHGVFMEVLGTGVLITGDSSIGKSELALELLTRCLLYTSDAADDLLQV